MALLEKGDVFYINRLGYPNMLPEKDRKNIYDHLGYIKITVTKVNKKTFKTDYSDELYNSIPREWFKKLTISNCLTKIIRIFSDDDTFYFKYAKTAYNLLTDSQKVFVKKELKKESKIKGEQYAKMKLNIYLSRLKDD